MEKNSHPKTCFFKLNKKISLTKKITYLKNHPAS